MDAVIRPELPEEERRALLEALADDAPDPYGSAWRAAALAEGAQADEP